ncbi:MAG: hypothetical protein JWM16_6333 [Verrucomicrobiales bacterium]|nr:hypothetical protein [Verrucomicrobiales bacterium]
MSERADGPTNQQSDLRPIGTRFVTRFPPSAFSTDTTATITTYEVVSYSRVADAEGAPWRWAERINAVAVRKLSPTGIFWRDGGTHYTFEDGSEFVRGGDHWLKLPNNVPETTNNATTSTA